MQAVSAQVAKHPGVLVLLAAIVLGQILDRLAQPHLLDSTTIGQLPLVPIAVLAAQLILALLILWFRVRLGVQLVAAARERAFSLPQPASLPKRYVVADPAAHVMAGILGIIDLALLLLVQSTLRGPILVLGEHFLIPRTTAESVFVAMVVLIAVLMLIKLYRAGGPVLVLLLWWGLDRVVPTAGFLGSHAAVASAPTRTTRPLSAPQAAPVAEARTPLEATVAAATSRPEQATVAAATSQPQAAIVGAPSASQLEATVAAPTSQPGEAIVGAPSASQPEATVAAATSQPHEATVAATTSQTTEATVAARVSRPEEPMVAAADPEATVLAEATMLTANRPTDDAATVLKPETP